MTMAVAPIECPTPTALAERLSTTGATSAAYPDQSAGSALAGVAP